jgi:hypothetical protein
MIKKTFLYKEINANKKEISDTVIKGIKNSFLPKFHKDLTNKELIVKNTIVENGYYLEIEQKQREFCIYIYISRHKEKATFQMGYNKRKDTKVYTVPKETIGDALEELTRKLLVANVKQIFIK